MKRSTIKKRGLSEDRRSHVRESPQEFQTGQGYRTISYDISIIDAETLRWNDSAHLVITAMKRPCLRNETPMIYVTSEGVCILKCSEFVVVLVKNMDQI